MLATAFATTLGSLYVHAVSAIATVATAAPNVLKSKKVEPTTLDWVGSIMAIASLGAAILIMLAMAAYMTYKTLTQHESMTTSWPPAQEQTFTSFTETSERVHQKSWLYALVGAGVATVIALGIYFGVTPQKDKIGETMDLTTFDKKGKAPAPGPSATP